MLKGEALAKRKLELYPADDTSWAVKHGIRCRNEVHLRHLPRQCGLRIRV